MKDKKYRYYIIFILINVFICFFSSLLSAKTVIVLPEGIDLEEVNKNTNKKLVNRYKSEDQLKNQYKGKLKYKPDNDGLNMYRDGKFYTSVYFLPKGFLLSNIDNSNIDTKSNNSYSVSAGYYFTNNIAVEIDYSELIHKVSNVHLIPLNGFKMQSRNYILDFLIESNYSRFIPFVSIGLGIMQSSFSESNVGGIESNIAVAYQIIGGFEIAFTDSLLASIRYKFFQTIGDIRVKYNNNSHKMKLGNVGNFSIGLKYIW